MRLGELDAAPREHMIGALNPRQRASWAVQTQLLAHGVSTLRLPRGAVVGVEAGEPVSDLGFIGLQGPGTSLAGESLAVHATSVNEVLRAKDIPILEGWVCSTSQRSEAVDYAESIKYPIQVAPANSDAPQALRSVVYGKDELLDALDRVAVDAPYRRVDREVNGRTVWLQKAPSGYLLRILVAGQTVFAAVQISIYGAWSECVSIAEIHPDIQNLAVASLQAVPGLGHGEVELVLQDTSREPSAQGVAVLNVRSSVSPESYHRQDHGLKIVGDVVKHYVHQSGVKYATSCTERATKTSLSGVVEPERFKQRLERKFGQLIGTALEPKIESEADGAVSLDHQGDVRDAALIAEACVRGLARGLRASSARTEVVD